MRSVQPSPIRSAVRAIGQGQPEVFVLVTPPA
jgi:hypothetical protein